MNILNENISLDVLENSERLQEVLSDLEGAGNGKRTIVYRVTSQERGKSL